MKRIIILSIIPVLFLSACGGSSTINTKIAKTNTAEQQVRQTYYRVLTAGTSSHPENMCRYYRPQDNTRCVGLVVAATAMHMSPSSIVSYGWQSRLATAKIVVHGNTASILSAVASAKGGPENAFTRIGGIWYKNLGKS